MAQKFIITRRGILRIDHVAMHRHLLQPADACLGGGFWRIDPLKQQLVLSGRSYDFGPPLWSYLIRNNVTLQVPRTYRGLAIVYLPDYPEEPMVAVSRELALDYY